VASHSLAGALAAGGAITSAALVALMHYEHSARTFLSTATSP